MLGLAPLLDAVMGTIGVEETFVTAGATDEGGYEVAVFLPVPLPVPLRDEGEA